MRYDAVLMRNASSCLCLLVLPLFAGCSANPPPPNDGTTVEVTPPTSSAIEPASAPAPEPSATATAAAKPDVKAIAPIDPAKACFLCRSNGKKCERPDVASKMATMTCGDGFKLASAKIEGAPLECDPGCCRPATGKGADRDADGLFDANDKCPDEPEDVDGLQDADGCPDPDNDQDGLQDPKDMCCFSPEDFDGKEDLDGCPEP